MFKLIRITDQFFYFLVSGQLVTIKRQQDTTVFNAQRKAIKRFKGVSYV